MVSQIKVVSAWSISTLVIAQQLGKMFLSKSNLTNLASTSSWGKQFNHFSLRLASCFMVDSVWLTRFSRCKASRWSLRKLARTISVSKKTHKHSLRCVTVLCCETDDPLSLLRFGDIELLMTVFHNLLSGIPPLGCWCLVADVHVASLVDVMFTLTYFWWLVITLRIAHAPMWRILARPSPGIPRTSKWIGSLMAVSWTMSATLFTTSLYTSIISWAPTADWCTFKGLVPKNSSKSHRYTCVLVISR